MSDSHHVVPNPDGGWDVKRANATRASGHFSTQKKAVDAGRVISRNQKTEFVIHRRDGTIEKKDHVVPSPQGGWDVKRGGASKASKHFSTKKDAVDWGRSVSRNRGSDLYVHRRDGTVERKVSPGGESLSKHRDTHPE